MTIQQVEVQGGAESDDDDQKLRQGVRCSKIIYRWRFRAVIENFEVFGLRKHSLCPSRLLLD